MCMEDNLVHARTCDYNVHYHVVWLVKYRQKVMTPTVETVFKQIVTDIGKDKDFIIERVEIVDMDHVHIFISAHPKQSISYMVKMLKGISGRKLFETFPDLRQKLWKGQLWNHSYYVETVGEIRQDIIEKYIANQETKY